MEIVDLIENVRINIEDNKIKTNNVGNRPHCPVFVAFYGSDAKNCSAFANNIQNTWSSQICKQLLFYKYDFTNSKIEFIEINNGTTIPIDIVYERISETSRNRDIFARYDMWCLYNIIDTTDISFEKFKDLYYSLNNFNEELDRRTRSMIVVVLRDDRARERKELNYKIRNFLRNESIYDSVVIVSNRARGGFEIGSEELYKIISSLVLLSNNDAVANIDDEHFNERVRKLYSKTPLIMSYNSLSKPTKEILSCMVQRLITEVYEYIDNAIAHDLSMNDIEVNLGIENGKLTVFERYTNLIKQKIEQEVDCYTIFQYLPMTSPIVMNRNDLSSKSVGQLGEIDNKSLVLIANEMCNKYIECENGQELFYNYSKFINDNLNLVNVNNIHEERILEVFETLLKKTEKPDLAQSVKDYFSKLVVSILKTQFIIPYCIKLVNKICNTEEIKATKDNIEKFIHNINEELPISGFDEISTFYGNNMSNYLQTDKGKIKINQILKVGNTYEDICRAVEEMLYDANEYCNEKINLPFITIWANALKLHEGEVFGRIRNTLYGDGDDAILLRGAYPVIEELSVYMLHCYDRNGENETDLYKQFKKAYKDVHNVQFFNTGNDDSIESIKFFKCSGTSLVLGMSEAVS